MVVLTTERLTLRPVGGDDVTALRDHWNLPDVRRYLFDGEEVSIGLVEEIVADSAADFAERGYGLWVMLSDQDMVGICGLRCTKDGQPELLYSVDPARWGQGLATEAARAVLRHAAAIGLGTVVAETDEGNAASEQVVRRLGMTVTEERSGPAGAVRRYSVNP